jgi:ketopantoate reductase
MANNVNRERTTRIAVVGGGAMGCVRAACLARAGQLERSYLDQAPP